MTFVLKVHNNPDGNVVAACDKDVLGETFTEGDTQLHVDEGFYGTEEAELADIVAVIKSAHTANIVGTQLVDALIEEGIISEEEVHTADNIKHVQLFFL